MALRVRDRVLEVTTTTGTGGITLAGSITGFQSFASGVGNGNTTYYAIVHHDLQNYAQWEVGQGTLSGSSLSRDTVLDSSDGPGNKVNLSAGVKNVFVTVPGEQILMKDVQGRVFIGSGVINPTQDNMLYVDGDIKASGINVESGVIIQQSPTPSPSDNKLYNLGGTLYWGDNALSSGGELFNISASSGTADLSGDVLGINAGSGIFFNGGENVNISMSDLGNGSGQLTFDVPNASTDFLITAESGLNSISILQGSGISFVGENGIGVTLTDRTSPSGSGLPVLGGSGVITITGPDLSLFVQSAGSGIIIDGAGTVHATSGSVDASGIVQLTNTISDDATKALTPKAVNDAGYLSSFPITASEGLGHFDVTTVSGVASGILFKSGSNTTVTLSRAASGSGVITIDSTDTTFTVASGLVMDGDNVIRHEDTSTQASVNNTGNTFIQDVTLDEYGHITALNSASATGIGTRFMLGASDGLGNIQLEDGSGIYIVGGTNIDVTLSNADGGSGVITIDAPTAVGVSLVGSPTAASGGIAFFNGPTSIAYDSDITWDSGNLELGVSGSIRLDQITAPLSATQDRLYNIGGNLTWNGNNLLGGSTGGAPTTQGSPTPGGSGVAFYTGTNTLGYDTGFTWDSGNNRLGINADGGDPHSTLHSYGSFATKVTPVGDSYSADDEHVILFENDNFVGTGTITLPASTTCTGRIYHIKNASTSPSGVLVQCSGAETFDGIDKREPLWVKGDVLSIVAGSGQWEVLNRDYTPLAAELLVSESGFRIPWRTSSVMGWGEVGYATASGMIETRTHDENGNVLWAGNHAEASSGAIEDGYKVRGFKILRDGDYHLSYNLVSKHRMSTYYDYCFVTVEGSFPRDMPTSTGTRLLRTSHSYQGLRGYDDDRLIQGNFIVPLHSGDCVRLRFTPSYTFFSHDEESFEFNGGIRSFAGTNHYAADNQLDTTRFTIRELR